MGLTTRQKKCCFLATLTTIVVAQAVFCAHWLRGGSDDTPTKANREPITIVADYSHEWKSDNESIAVLRGRCRIIQGETLLQAQKVVVWHKGQRTNYGAQNRLAIYLEGDVRVSRPGLSRSEASLFVNLQTQDRIRFDVRHASKINAATQDAFFHRAAKRRRTANRDVLLLTQYAVPGEPEALPELNRVQFQPQNEQMLRLRMSPRSRIPYNIDSSISNATTPPERVTVLTGGIHLLIEGLTLELEDESMPLGAISLASDRMVIWSKVGQTGQLPTLQSRNDPLTVYLEGNIVIRQGEQVVRAERAIYDAREDRALLYNAELKAFVPELQEYVRVRADVLRQLSRESYHAQNAWMSTSQFGRPGYRVEATDVRIENRYTRSPNGEIDPATGEPLMISTPWITSLNNTFRVEDFPIFFLPYVSSPARNPKLPLRGATVKQDDIFGGQLRTQWDLFQLTGIDQRPGTTWNLMADYFTSRGPAVGTGG